MGMPICLWCKDNFERIASSWGKVIQFDDRAELSKSYMFVKEFGSEIYSVQEHPDLEGSTTKFVSSEEVTSSSAVKETPMEIGKSSERKMKGGYGKPEMGKTCLWQWSTMHQIRVGLRTDESVCFDKLDPICSLPFPPGFESGPILARTHQDDARVKDRASIPEGERGIVVVKECLRPINVDVEAPTAGWLTENDTKNDAGIEGSGSRITILPSVAPLAEDGVVGLCDDSGNSANLGSLSEESLYRINDTFVDGSRHSDYGNVKAIEECSGRDSIEDDSSAEFWAAKEV
ncbi:hypothetical protein PIB30_085544 [Stylosanthes scabra]|uniref:Uncharacterized protein n=1 Tax=Stylosanthes scabra TaxID=79078 RepID=A0ABU6RT62_9FABA|nr:hypothetical protein [Stylosanthes scabra]